LDVSKQITWSFDSTDYTAGLTPGTYKYTYDVTVGGVTKQFTVDLVLEDPCKNVSITVPEATTQIYVITDPDGSYTLQPMFSVTPDFCPYEITATYNEDVIDFNSDEQKITIPTITDTLTPSNPLDDGRSNHEYPVITRITVTQADGTQTTESVTTTVIVKNPCLDPDYVTIKVAVFENLDYTVGTGAVTYDAHPVFTVETKPITH